MLQIKNGDLVRFSGDLEALLTGLPAEEVKVIREGIMRQPFRVVALRTDGSAEVELSFAHETHFFHVNAADLQLIV